jgi:hypothetical protein
MSWGVQSNFSFSLYSCIFFVMAYFETKAVRCFCPFWIIITDLLKIQNFFIRMNQLTKHETLLYILFVKCIKWTHNGMSVRVHVLSPKLLNGCQLNRACDSMRSVGIAAGWTAGVRFLAGARFFTSQRPDQLWAHPASYPMGTGAFSPGVKRPGREADHSPACIARSGMMELYIHSPIRLHGIVLN